MSTKITMAYLMKDFARAIINQTFKDLHTCKAHPTTYNRHNCIGIRKLIYSDYLEVLCSLGEMNYSMVRDELLRQYREIEYV